MEEEEQFGEEEQWGEEEGFEEEEVYYDEEGVEYYYEYEEEEASASASVSSVSSVSSVASVASAVPDDDEEEEGRTRAKLSEEEEIALLESKGWVNTSKIKGPPARMAPRPPPALEKMAAGKKDTWQNVKSDRDWAQDVDLT